MAKARSLVGLDVHATKIVAAVLDGQAGELQFFSLRGDVIEAAGLCAGLPRPVRAAYEAGSTGYGLARELLVRAREAVRVDLMRCRHRLSKLLLRHGHRFDDGAATRSASPALASRRRPAAGRRRGQPQRRRHNDAAPETPDATTTRRAKAKSATAAPRRPAPAHLKADVAREQGQR